MTNVLTTTTPSPLTLYGKEHVPALFADAGEKASYRFIEFFTATIRNPHTRAAYFRAVNHLSEWCKARNLDLPRLNPVVLALYIEELQKTMEVTSVKQHLSAIRNLFDYLVTGHIVPFNPAAAVKPPRYSTDIGLTPILTGEEARELIDSVDVTSVWGLRNRALISVMICGCARVAAATGMLVEDYFREGKEWKLRLHEKRGKLHVVPANRLVVEYVDEYLDAAGIRGEQKKPMFRKFTSARMMTDEAMTPGAALQVVKRYVKDTELADTICCHSFRGTGITLALEHGATLEEAQRLAAHASIQTTMLYDRRDRTVKRDTTDRITF
jgi:site-specific recombinase XerD